MKTSYLLKNLESQINHWKKLNWEPKKWLSLNMFAEDGNGRFAFINYMVEKHKKVIDDLNDDGDISGIYFIRARNKSGFYKQTGIPLPKGIFYVGRSGNIARRFVRHLKVDGHNSASLVYKMTAKHKNPKYKKRDKNMDDKPFKNWFDKIQNALCNHCEMAYYQCENDETQALLEIFLSLRFDSPYNDWHTH